MTILSTLNQCKAAWQIIKSVDYITSKKFNIPVIIEPILLIVNL